MTRIAAASRPNLPALPSDAWEPTKTTLHLWVQIVGKVKLATTAPRNHWWNVPLYLDVRGLTTRRLHLAQVSFQIDFDFVDHRLLVRTNRGQQGYFRLHEGLSVAGFDRQLHQLLERARRGRPYPRRPLRRAHHHPVPERYRARRLRSRLRAAVLAGLGLGRHGARGVLRLVLRQAEPGPPVLALPGPGRHPLLRPPSPTSRWCRPRHPEAYSHEVISFGFWFGDDNTHGPAFYSYTAPEPSGLTDQPLQPASAVWRRAPNGSMALLAYDQLRDAEDPRITLLAFLQSAYDAGAHTGGWDRKELASSFCPSGVELQALFQRGATL